MGSKVYLYLFIPWWKVQCGEVEEDEGKETRSAQIEGSFKRDGVWLMLCDHAVMRPGE